MTDVDNLIPAGIIDFIERTRVGIGDPCSIEGGEGQIHVHR